MTEFPEQLVYGTSGGWTLTGEYRVRVNPDRYWFNAWIEPKTIIQARMTKLQYDKLDLNETCNRIYKWLSINHRNLVEDSED